MYISFELKSYQFSVFFALLICNAIIIILIFIYNKQCMKICCVYKIYIKSDYDFINEI